MSNLTHWNWGGRASGELSSLLASNSTSLIFMLVFTSHTCNKGEIWWAHLLYLSNVLVTVDSTDWVLPAWGEAWRQCHQSPPVPTPRAFKQKKNHKLHLHCSSLPHYWRLGVTWAEMSSGVVPDYVPVCVPMNHLTLSVLLLSSTSSSFISSAVTSHGSCFFCWSLKSSVNSAIWTKDTKDHMALC